VQLLKYQTSDGTIVTIWEANSQELLDANQVGGDPAYDYLVQDVTMDLRDLQDNYLVIGGVLVPKST
jgi:hypothetical protein